MDAKRICSSEKEQDWIQKYRAALDISSADESRPNAIRTAFSKAAATLRFGIGSLLQKAVSALRKPVVRMQPTKAEGVPTPTMSELRPLSVRSSVVAAAKHPSPRGLSTEKAS